MSDELSGSLLERVARVLKSHGVDDHAFTGGIAVGVWSAPRQTRDLDVCGTLRADEVNRLLALRDGMRTGGGDLPDTIRFRVGDWDVDLFVSKDDYDRACLGRAIPVDVDGVTVRVVAPEDLLIHKLIKLRTDRRRLLQDLADIRAVIDARAGDLDWSHLDTWLPRGEAQLLRDVASIGDDELVRRMLAP
jgi:hypothetical protein